MKTLKDLDWYNPHDKGIIVHKDSGSFVNIKKLKQEAINWIKEDIKELREQGMVAKNIVAWDLLREWMRRLNITEEDLK